MGSRWRLSHPWDDARPHEAVRWRTAPTFSGCRDLATLRCDGRGEGLSLLHHVGDDEPRLGGAGLAAAMHRVRRDVESIARFEHACVLAPDRELETAFEHIGGLEAGMRVGRDRHAWFD